VCSRTVAYNPALVSLSPGTAIGPYEIVALLGAGGMGEVYRARDPRLGRDVAIKVLPASLAEDADRRERFEREARAASALNHPHICALYDIGRHQDTDYLVMELLDGESLEQRLTKGPLPLDQALRIAIDLADALSKAHRQGIVHRDLKPGNVMLTRQGAKLLDFGLARVDAPPAPGSGSFLPTQQRALTQAGTVLGTFQYMAPEQLEGGDADARTDIFAFGALVYEMITGRKAFEGKSQASLISAIMAGTPPPISSLNATTPPALDRVIRTCLAKDPDERWQTAQDLASELRWIAGGGSQAGTPAPVAPRRRSHERTAWIAAGVFALVAAGAIARLATLREPAREPTRFSIPAPKDVTLQWPRLSPDGRTIAFVGIDPQGRRTVYVRPLNAFDATQLPGTEGVQRPFWSPDSRQLAFFANGQLKKIAVTGGPTQLLCTFPGGSDGSWGEGVILFDGRAIDPIRRVPDSGGVPAVATTADAAQHEVGAGWPSFLPDGRHFIFVANDTNGPIAIKVGSIDSPETTRLADAESRVEFAAEHVFYVTQQTLMARPFSSRKRAFTGDPFPVTDRMQTQTLGLANFSVSHTGDLAYSSEAQDLRTHLAWFDRSGKELDTIGEPRLYTDFALSPDETRVATSVAPSTGRNQLNESVWVMDVKRGVASRLTFGDEPRLWPFWSPDGTRVVYTSATKGGLPNHLAHKLASGAGDEQPLGPEADGTILVTDWSADGKQLLLIALPPAGDNVDVVTMAADGRSAAVPFVHAPKPIFASSGRFSPDGRWGAYQSHESGRNEIYVQSFPPSGSKWQISTSGGAVPMWTAGGKEIVYVSSNDTFYAAAVKPTSNGFDVGTPVKLFQHRLAHGARERNRWTITRDGQRLLLNTLPEAQNTQTIQVVLNWAAGLQKP